MNARWIAHAAVAALCCTLAAPVHAGKCTGRLTPDEHAACQAMRDERARQEHCNKARQDEREVLANPLVDSSLGQTTLRVVRARVTVYCDED